MSGDAASVAFRAEDEVLLRRLEDDDLLARLWAWHAAGARRPRPHARAAGMIALLRALPDGEHAAARAREGHVQALASLLEPPSLAGRAPELLHHAAIYCGEVADALDEVKPEQSSAARIRSIAAWLALAEEERYLAELARAVVGDAIDAAEAARLAADAPLDTIDALGARAAAGARSQSAQGRAALHALARVGDACTLAACGEALRARAIRRAEAKRAAAIEAALTPIGEALDEAEARGEAQARAGDVLGRAVPLWHWAEYDEAVEHFVVDRIIPIAWEIYREHAWARLRALIAPFEQLVDSLAARIRSDPEKIAYAGPCAQMLVFRSELESTLARQIAVGERAIALCPTHRNGRLVMASYLCDSATRALQQMPIIVRKKDLATAEAQIARAEELYPSSPKIAPAKQLLDEARRRPAI